MCLKLFGNKGKYKFKVGATVYPRSCRQGYLKSSYIGVNTPVVVKEIKEDGDGDVIYVCGFHNYEYFEEELSKKPWRL